MANYARNHVCFLFSAVSATFTEMYIDLKNYSWAEDEGIWRPCRGTPPFPLDRYQDDPDALLSIALSTHNDAHHHFAYGHAPPLVCKIMWNKKTTVLMIMCNLLFHFCAHQHVHFKCASHYK